ncbi:HPP family protein [Halostella litorea]|uniref:HPP family protein n=1 Tax=Halostella litorea TaxID=2528831 RepID=UPI0010918A9F|nr:HPP family protein [Halostella litorea]
MDRRGAVTSAYAGLLLVPLGAVAWATGEPFVFPSLGPSAYLLAKVRRGPTVAPHRVAGGHAVGVAAGLVSSRVVAPGTAMTGGFQPFSAATLGLAAAAALAVTLTAVGMQATDTNHPPACATTLIVSLGILPTVEAGATIVVAVAFLLAVHRAALAATAAALARLGQSRTAASGSR